MCEGGRVLHHLRNGIADGRNLVLLAGYQAENTLGRRIMERRQEVKIFDEMMPLRAEVASLAELSGHADQGELIRWIKPIAEQSEASISGSWRARRPGRLGKGTGSATGSQSSQFPPEAKVSI